MKEKYNTEFTLVDDDRAVLGAEYLTIYVQNADHPDDKILVTEELTDDGAIYHDNYVAVKYQQKTKELVEESASGLFEEYRVIHNANSMDHQPDEYDNSTTFEEFISQPKSKIYACVLLPPEHSDQNREQELKQLEQLCIERHLAGIFDLCYTSDTEAYRTADSDADMMNAGQWCKAIGKFIINGGLSVSSESWR